MGLRYDQALVKRLLKGVIAMEDSSTFQAIIAEGEMRGRRKGLLLMGREQFGEPTKEEIAALEAIEEPERLDELFVKFLHVKSWQEWLDLPRPPAPRRRRAPRDKR